MYKQYRVLEWGIVDFKTHCPIGYEAEVAILDAAYNGDTFTIIKGVGSKEVITFPHTTCYYRLIEKLT